MRDRCREFNGLTPSQRVTTRHKVVQTLRLDAHGAVTNAYTCCQSQCHEHMHDSQVVTTASETSCRAQAEKNTAGASRTRQRILSTGLRLVCHGPTAVTTPSSINILVSILFSPTAPFSGGRNVGKQICCLGKHVNFKHVIVESVYVLSGICTRRRRDAVKLFCISGM